MFKLKKTAAAKIISAVLIVFSLLFTQSAFTANARKVVDRQAPTAPQKLTAVSVTYNSVKLQWSPSTDNKGVASYLIYRNSTYVGSTTSTSYTLSGLLAATAYSFYVKAKDYSGNLSPSSNVLSVKTAAAPPVTASSASSSSSSTSSSSATNTTTTGGKIISAYYASWAAYSGYMPLNIPASQVTNINYAFAKIGSDLKIAMGDTSVDPTNFNQLNQLKASHPNVRTIISIGGWDDSGLFSDAVLTDSSRTVFADSVVAFIRQYGFNGVDIDWEYPVAGGLSANVSRPEDKTNFTLLLQKLREKLNAQSAADGKKYLLTIAGGAGSYYLSNIEPSAVASYVDYINVMTYDMHGNWDQYTDFNAPLYTPAETSPQYKISIDTSVNNWLSKGVPASKLVVGMPFYGYIYNGATGGNNGLYQTFTSGSSISYDKIAANYLTNASFNKFFHPDARVPWLFNGLVFISYDNEQSLTEKAKYIMQKGLAGAAIWELSQNKNGILLNALYSNLQ